MAKKLDEVKALARGLIVVQIDGGWSVLTHDGEHVPVWEAVRDPLQRKKLDELSKLSSLRMRISAFPVIEGGADVCECEGDDPCSCLSNEQQLKLLIAEHEKDKASKTCRRQTVRLALPEDPMGSKQFIKPVAATHQRRRVTALK